MVDERSWEGEGENVNRLVLVIEKSVEEDGGSREVRLSGVNCLFHAWAEMALTSKLLFTS